MNPMVYDRANITLQEGHDISSADAYTVTCQPTERRAGPPDRHARHGGGRTVATTGCLHVVQGGGRRGQSGEASLLPVPGPGHLDDGRHVGG